MPLKQAFHDQVTRLAIDRFVHLWRPMAGWTITVWGVGFLAIGPLSSLILGRLLITGDRVIIGNFDLATWLFSPWGALYILLGGGLLLITMVIRFAGLFHMLTDDRIGHRVSVRRTALRLLVEFPSLLRLSLAAAALGIVSVLPLVGGYALLYTLLLGAHDINYYLDITPPEWHQALWLSAGWTALWGATALALLLRISLALPAYLEGYRPFRAALAESWNQTRGKSARILYVLGVGLLFWLLCRGLLNWALLEAADTVVLRLGLPLRGMVYASAAHLLTGLALDALLSFLGFSVAATVLTKFYYEDTGLHQEPPPLPRLRRWPAHTIRVAGYWLKPRRSLPLLVVALGVTTGLALFQLQRAPTDISFVISAHRAGMHLAPENSLSALERSIASGADYAEIDVQRTRDGVVVVFHDADLMRLARDPRRIATSDYRDLAEVDIGMRYYPEFAGEPLATLEDFLARAKDRIWLNIELKYYGFDPGLAEACVRLVQAYGMEDQVVFMSLRMEGIRQVRNLLPEAPIGFLSAVSAGDLSRLEVDFVAVPQSRATSTLIRTARRRDMEVHVWTVNRPERMVLFIQRGVDGIITDAPDVAVDLRTQLSAFTPAELLLLHFRRVW